MDFTLSTRAPVRVAPLIACVAVRRMQEPYTVRAAAPAPLSQASPSRRSSDQLARSIARTRTEGGSCATRPAGSRPAEVRLRLVGLHALVDVVREQRAARAAAPLPPVLRGRAASLSRRSRAGLLRQELRSPRVGEHTDTVLAELLPIDDEQLHIVAFRAGERVQHWRSDGRLQARGGRWRKQFGPSLCAWRPRPRCSAASTTSSESSMDEVSTGGIALEALSRPDSSTCSSTSNRAA